MVKSHNVKRPFFYCWLLIPVLLILGILKGSNSHDIQVYDTYYVILDAQVCFFLSLLLGLLGAGYYSISKLNGKLIPPLTKIHLVSTTCGILLFIIYITITDSARVSDLSNGYGNQLMVGIVLILIVSQLFFLYNILVVLSNRRQ